MASENRHLTTIIDSTKKCQWMLKSNGWKLYEELDIQTQSTSHIDFGFAVEKQELRNGET